MSKRKNTTARQRSDRRAYLNRRKRLGHDLTPDQEAELVELAGDPPDGEAEPDPAPAPAPDPTAPPPPAPDPAAPPPAPAPAPPPVPKVLAPLPGRLEAPPAVERPAKVRSGVEDGDEWLERYPTGIGNGREFVCHTVAGIAHKIVAGWEDELKAAGVEPLISVRTPEMEHVYVVAMHHVLPKDWKLTPEIILAATSASTLGQRVYHNRRIVDQKRRADHTRPEPRPAPPAPVPTTGDERAVADPTPAPSSPAPAPAPAPSSGPVSLAPPPPPMEGFVG